MPDGLTLPLLPDVVPRPSREAASIDPRLRWRITAGIVAGHLVLLLLLDAALRPRFAPPQRVEDGVVIRWIDVIVPAPSVPEPVVASAAVPVGASPRLAEVPAAPSTPPGPVGAGDHAIDTARLFDPNGRLALSTAVVDAAAQRPAPDYAPPGRDALPPIRSPIPYRKTRFDDDWVPDGETLGDEVMRRVAVEREFKTPWGTRWRCAIVLVFAACGDVPPPMMKNPPKMPWETYVEDAGPAADFEF